MNSKIEMITTKQHKYQEKFLSFLKRHNLFDEIKYNYLIKNATFININTDEEMSFIGCYYTKNEHNIVTEVKLFLPKLNDDICVLIAIHEYIHGYLMYDKINKTYKTKASEEVLPMFYELLYYLEEKNEKLEEYRDKIIRIVKKEKKIKYILGLIMQSQLLDKYNNDIYNIDLEVKKQSPKLIKIIKNKH